ncbi:hypothetical protein [Nocardia sp. N2S4-5]
MTVPLRGPVLHDGKPWELPELLLSRSEGHVGRRAIRDGVDGLTRWDEP